MPTTYPTYMAARAAIEQIKARATFLGMHPVMQQRVGDLIVASGGSVGFGEGLRSEEVQKALFLARYVPDPNGATLYLGVRYRKLPNVAGAAPPGRSMHELGLAADLVGDMDWVTKNCAKFGLKNFRNIGSEPWHVQPTELPNSRAEYEHDGSVWAKVQHVDPPTQPTASKGAISTTPPNVEPEDRGDVVRHLQDVLIRLQLIDENDANRDGYYGPATQAVIKKFQTDHGLGVDGRVGPKTWAALLALDPISTDQ